MKAATRVDRVHPRKLRRAESDERFPRRVRLSYVPAAAQRNRGAIGVQQRYLFTFQLRHVGLRSRSTIWLARATRSTLRLKRVLHAGRGLRRASLSYLAIQIVCRKRCACCINFFINKKTFRARVAFEIVERMHLAPQLQRERMTTALRNFITIEAYAFTCFIYIERERERETLLFRHTVQCRSSAQMENQASLRHDRLYAVQRVETISEKENESRKLAERETILDLRRPGRDDEFLRDLQAATSFYNTMTPSYSIYICDKTRILDSRITIAGAARERPDNEHMLRVAAGK
ncbi:unnamed protein product [Trichogramma brassicae]|uniref:Uncharacterized protein n=1 Tax=Trichogramma brassicae TaxID=86971 RepID=A0A6H5I3D0_9HYME|nr:unnamed protein product [Trichogramma brassicae]